MKKGFTVVELFFWLAILALIVGGFVYKNAKQFQKAPVDDPAKQGAVDRLRVQDSYNQRSVNEN
jgi:hypothetical protein